MAITHPVPFRCVVIGEGALPIQCAEIVIDAGHTLCGVISPNAQLRAWAEAHAVPFCHPTEDMSDFVRRMSIDYLFSIVNYVVLPAELLTMPRRAAINYHDSPLPRYAGLYATSWAILSGETQHAISWHLMTSHIDAGDILLQYGLEIAPNDTAGSLNVKCYDAAVRTFPHLVHLLASGQATPRPQDLAHRTYRGLYARPAAAGVLDWNQPAHRLMALVRALQFGHTPNDLGHPKLLLPNAAYLVAGLEVLSTHTDALPGTLVEVQAEQLVVATGSTDVAITHLQHMTGAPITLSVITQQHGLHAGMRLPVLDTDTGEYLSAWHRTVCRHEPFWRQRLADLHPLTLSALRASTPPDQPGAHQRLALDLPPALVETDHAAAYVRAAFAVYLARVTGSYHFDLGMQPPQMPHDQIELASLFATIVPLRVTLEPDQPFAQIVASLDAAWDEAVCRHTFPRDIVARYPDLWKHKELQQGVQLPLCICGGGPEGAAHLPADCALALVWEESGRAWWLYDPAVVSPSLAADMGRQFCTLLAHACAEPQQPISHLALLDAATYQRMVVEWNATAVSYPADQCVHHLVAVQATRTPDAVAVVYEGKALTYAELQARANQLAHHLSGLGVGPEVLVALCVERSLELVVGLLGILTAGGAYVPLDPDYPAERLDFMLADCQAPVLLTQAHLQATLPTHAAHVVCLDRDWPTIAQQPTTAPHVPVTPEHLAYVIYTSGSTGSPKGVQIAHRAIVNRLLWMQDTYQLTPADRVLQKTPFSFDVSVWEFFWPLLTGACLVVARPEGHKDSRYLADLIQQAQITTLHFVPSMLQVFLAEAGGAPCGSLRHVFCSGEALPYDLQTRFFAHLPQVALHNLYGPTEAAVDVSFWPCRANDPGPVVPIGYPVANTQLYLLDGHLQPVPIGVPGELYIGGVQLARGYLNRPDLTAERFIANPFGAGRLYRTGDLARYRPDGAIEFLGRADFQVKLRGFRIELGEIEAVLSQHPNVQQAVVITRDDGMGMRLIAYVVGNDCDPATLRDHLTARLPDYMVPAAFVVLAALPLTPNGKVDRKALPVPDAESVVRETYTPPRTAIEQTLAAIWQSVLGLEQLGIHDSFFALGGDSILAIQVISRARAAGLPLAVRDLLQHQTIATLAAVVPAAPGAPTSETAPGPVPLTPIQHWFLAPDPPEPHHFNQAMALDLVADVDIPRLHQALQHLAVQHAALRLRFTRTASGWQQTLAAEPAAVRLDVHDLTPLATDAQPAQIATTAAAAQASLNLAQCPLLHAVLWQRGPTTPARLLLVLHHLVVDWVSWAVLLDDLAAAYQQQAAGAGVALPAPTTSFPTWARWLAAHGPQVVADERAFWHMHAQTTVPPLPRDVPQGANTVALTEHVTRRLSAATTHALLHTAHAAYHTRINDLLLTALALALADWTEAPQVRIDLEGHGREDLDPTFDLSRTLGWFTSLFPVVLDIVPDDLATSLIAVKETLRAIPRHGIGYGILRFLADDPVLATAPAAEVSFNYLGQSDHLALTPPFLGMGGDDAFGLYRSPQQQRAHLLEISGMVVNGQAQFTFSFSRAMHDPAGIAQVAATFVTALERLVAHCQTSEGAYTPGDFPLAGLAQPTLDQVVAAVRRQQPAVGPPRSGAIQALAPLTPTQQGMLATTLADPTAGYQIEQLTWTWPSTINLEAYVQAWQDVIARHSGLRVLVVTNAATPYQAIVTTATLPVTHHDWRSLDPAEQQARLDTFLAEDRRQGIDVGQAPLLRLALIQLDNQQVQVVWTHHHLLLDGWSLPLLLHDLDQCYVARVAGQAPQLPPAPAYETYLAWLAQQDRAAAEQFWRAYMVDVTQPPPLTPQRDLARPATYGRHTTWLAAATHERLQIAARQWQVPLNTLVQAAWALVLHRISGCEEVVFGATVAGRPPEVAGIAEMVGLFISTVPVRVAIVAAQPVRRWLHALHTTTSAQQPYSYCTSGEIQQWSEVSGGLPLHESLLVVENYPTIDAVPGSLSVQMGEVRSEGAQTHYPLTLLVLPETELGLHAVYDERHFSAHHITGLLEQFGQVLTQVATAGAVATVGDVLAQTAWADVWSAVPPIPAAGGQANYTAPHTPTEQTLADIWQDVLGLDKVGLHDNFFSLGGHSLLAVRLLTAIEQAIGHALPLASLFQHPTIATLAELLDGVAAPLTVRSLVPIQPAGTQPPLFLVHPVGGHVLCYEPVARWVATDQPVYGLQAVGLAGEHPPLDTIEAMATHYIAELRTVQPHGPYVLGGWSLGGLVAFEMAHQLQMQGETVARLILIDTFRPNPAFAAVEDEAALLQHFLADVQGQPQTALLRDNGHDLPIDSATTLTELLAHPDVAPLLPPGITPAHLHSWWQVFCANMHALHRYDPAPYAGPVTLVYATDQEDDAAATWQGCAPQMECVPIAGDHYTIMQEPQVQVLAALVRDHHKVGVGPF